MEQRRTTIRDILTWPYRHRSYTVYSIGCGVVWAVILIIAAAKGSSSLHNLLMVFGGFAIGWLSATIARSVYPPPKSRRAAG
jgi:hypothetical protein